MQQELTQRVVTLPQETEFEFAICKKPEDQAVYLPKAEKMWYDGENAYLRQL